MIYFNEIQRIVCAGERIPSENNYQILQGKTRQREIVLTRQIIMYFLRLFNGKTLSWKRIGSFYGKDHATAMHATKAIEDLIDTDKDAAAKIMVYEIQIQAVISFEKNMIIDNFESIKEKMKAMISDNIPLTYEMITVYNALLEKTLIK